MKHDLVRRLRLAAARCLLGGAAVALVTYVCYRLHLTVATSILLYLLVVVLLSLTGDFGSAFIVTLGALLSLNYFLGSPPFGFRIAQPLDEVALLAFLVTALIITRLTTRVRRRNRDVQAANDRLRLVIDGIPVLVASTRPDGTVEFLNQRWRNFANIPPEDAEGWAWITAVHPDDRARIMDEWRATLEKGQPWETESRMRRADGTYRWLWTRVEPVRDHEGRITQWYGTSVDIEDRKQAEARIREIDRELRQLVDAVPQHIFVLAPDGTRLYANQGMLDYHGLTLAEFQSGDSMSSVHPDDRERTLAERTRGIGSGAPFELESRVLGHDGRYRWFLIRAKPLHDDQGRLLRWYGTQTDIDDRKRTEELLRKQARLLDLTHDTVFVRDIDEVITYWNRGARELYGWAGEEAIGKVAHHLLRTVFPAPFDEMMEELLRTGRWEGELVHTKRDGTQVNVASRWSLQRDDRGQPVATLETNNDVTERKRAEAELRESEERYRRIFQSAGVSIWEEDFSAVEAAIDELKAQGVGDFEAYFAAHPEFVRRAISLVRIKDVNQATIDLLKARTRDEVMASLHRVFLPETERVFAGELIAIAEGRSTFETETVLQTLEGDKVAVLLTIALPPRHAGLDSVLVSLMDITRRKQAEDALRRSEANLAEAQRLSHTGSWAHNLIRPEESYWSAEGYRIFGLDPDTAPSIPSLQEMRHRLHPADLPRVEAAVRQAIRAGHGVEEECRIAGPDGSTRYIHLVGHPVVSASGEVVELVGTVMDVTERKRAERAVRRARERMLEVRFAAVLDERTRLARDIHDTLLQGFTGVALKLLAGINQVTSPPEAIAALRDVVGLAQRTLGDARRAVWDLRTPSLAGGDFPAAVRAAAEDGLRGSPLRLDYTVEGSPRPMDQDVEAVVVRVVQEAIANIVKHADAGSVGIALSFEPRGVRLSVADDGRGFAVDPDFRSYGGHWGLLGMRERASQVHGRLSVRSSPGQGTNIELRVPYALGRQPRTEAGRLIPAP